MIRQQQVIIEIMNIYVLPKQVQHYSRLVKSNQIRSPDEIESNPSLRPIVDRVYFCDWFRAAMLFPAKLLPLVDVVVVSGANRKLYSQLPTSRFVPYLQTTNPTKANCLPLHSIDFVYVLKFPYRPTLPHSTEFQLFIVLITSEPQKYLPKIPFLCRVMTVLPSTILRRSYASVPSLAVHSLAYRCIYFPVTRSVNLLLLQVSRFRTPLASTVFRSTCFLHFV